MPKLTQNKIWDSNNIDSRITWVCFDCGDRCKRINRSVVSTVHNGNCDVCGDMRPVTHVRDFGFPDFTKMGVKK